MKNRMLLFIILILLAIVIFRVKLIISIKQIDYTVYDLNNDGIIDGFDMMIIKRHFLDIEKISNIKIIKSR